MRTAKFRIILSVFALIFAAGTASATSQFIMGTGGTSGTYYPFGGALSQIITDHTDGKIACVAQATGASVENLNLTDMGDLDLALVQNDISDYASKGTRFFRKPLKNIVAICRLYPEHIQIAVNAESGITKLEDLAGHNFSVGAPASGVEANVSQVLGEVGFYDGKKYTGIKPHFLSFAESTSHFKDRLIDGFQFSCGVPNAGIQEIVTAQPLRFLEVKGALRDRIIKRFPFFAPAIIEKGSYSGLDHDVQTIAVQACLIARRDMSDDDAYAVTKAIFENLDVLVMSHAKGKNVTLEHALDGLTLDLHPGAVRYYREAGLIK